MWVMKKKRKRIISGLAKIYLNAASVSLHDYPTDTRISLMDRIIGEVCDLSYEIGGMKMMDKEVPNEIDRMDETYGWNGEPKRLSNLDFIRNLPAERLAAFLLIFKSGEASVNDWQEWLNAPHDSQEVIWGGV